jgi:hypothetical protein
MPDCASLANFIEMRSIFVHELSPIAVGKTYDLVLAEAAVYGRRQSGIRNREHPN